MTRAAGRSHPGCVRSSNEDAFVADLALNIYVLADGMGGHRNGAVAAAITVRSVYDFVRASRFDGGITWPFGFDTDQSFEGNQLRNGVCLAHRNILGEGLRTSGSREMGSTVVAALVCGGSVTSANVGDSRLYLLRSRTLTQLSTDHSWAASALRSGTDPAVVKVHPMSHRLTRALGFELADVPVRENSLTEGDVLLLCTDGVHGTISEERIAAVLCHPRWEVDAQAERLLALALEAGGPDNATVIVARYADDPPKHRAKRWWASGRRSGIA